MRRRVRRTAAATAATAGAEHCKAQGVGETWGHMGHGMWTAHWESVGDLPAAAREVRHGAGGGDDARDGGRARGVPMEHVVKRGHVAEVHLRGKSSRV